MLTEELWLPLDAIFFFTWLDHGECSISCMGLGSALDCVPHFHPPAFHVPFRPLSQMTLQMLGVVFGFRPEMGF